jgi:hypothetical protein
MVNLVEPVLGKLLKKLFLRITSSRLRRQIIAKNIVCSADASPKLFSADSRVRRRPVFDPTERCAVVVRNFPADAVAKSVR